MNDKVSKAITLLRFPLMFMVIVLHSLFTTLDIDTYPIYGYTSNLLSNVLARVAVPMFFTISGYLFFYRNCEFSPSVYCQKLKKRIHSLLIPYILWIGIFILAYFVVIKMNLVGMSEGKTVYDYGVTDFLFAFFNENIGKDGGAFSVFSGEGAPIAFHLWFIRDLMLVSLFSPVVYALCKKKVLGGITSITLLLLWVMNMDLDASGHYYLSAFTFFSIGAFLQLQEVRLDKMERLWWLFLVYVLLAIIECVQFEGIRPVCMLWHNVNILIGITALFSVSLRACEKVSIPALLTESSFFVYGVHAMIVLLFAKLAQRFVPHVDWLMAIVYLFVPILCAIVCVGTYWAAKRVLPITTKLLTGGR